MAILFVDGFESFGTAPGSVTGLLNKYSNDAAGTHTNDTLVAGRFDGLALRPANDGGSGFNATDSPRFADTATIVCGFAFKLETGFPSAGNFRTLVSFESVAGNTECGVAIGDAGQLRVFRGSSATNIQTSTSSGLVVVDQWHYLEFKATIADAGSFDVYLDGVQVAFSSNSGDTLNSNAFVRYVRLYGRTTATAMSRYVQYDDFYVLNTSGSPNDFLGPRHVYTLFPTGVGDDDEFTPNSGDNYAAVDDNPIDSDTSYIEANTPDAQDLYQFGNVPVAAQDILAAVVYGIVKKTDVTSFDFIALAKSGGVEDESDPAAFVDSSSYVAAGGVILADPNTTSAWTVSGINAAQFGLKVGA